MFLAAEPFLGFVHAGVRGFSLGGWRRLPPHWNYNYLSCLSNSSTSRTRLAGAHTPIGSGEVRRNLCVWILPNSLRLLIALPWRNFRCQQRQRMRGNEKVLVSDAETNVDIPALVCVRAFICLSFGSLLRKSCVSVGHFCLCWLTPKIAWARQRSHLVDACSACECCAWGNLQISGKYWDN